MGWRERMKSRGAKSGKRSYYIVKNPSAKKYLRRCSRIKFVLDEVAARRPEAGKMNVDELTDNRFVKELEDDGFVRSLYGGK
jgi:hypothetical protein